MIAIIIVICICLVLIITEARVVNSPSDPQDLSQQSLPPLPSKWKKLFSLTEVPSASFTKQSKQINSDTDKYHKTITLMLKPSKSKFFSGCDLKHVFLKLGLVAGEDGFFYKTKGIRSVYTVCHIYQPGTFAFYELQNSSYSGCLFILCLDESENPVQSFEEMLEDFQSMGQELRAQILDENGEPLSLSNIHYIRQQVLRLSEINKVHDNV